MSIEVVQSILKKRYVGTRLVDNKDPKATVKSLFLLLNVGEKEPANPNKDYFFVSNLMSQIYLKTKQLHVCPYRLHATQGSKINLEMALFPFFFLQSNGAYDKRISIHDYLKYRMSYLFLLFTLYKPYLLLMYNICQFIMVLKFVSKSGLQKDIVAQKKKATNAMEVQFIESIIKHKLLESLIRSPH